MIYDLANKINYKSKKPFIRLVDIGENHYTLPSYVYYDHAKSYFRISKKHYGDMFTIRTFYHRSQEDVLEKYQQLMLTLNSSVEYLVCDHTKFNGGKAVNETISGALFAEFEITPVNRIRLVRIKHNNGSNYRIDVRYTGTNREYNCRVLPTRNSLIAGIKYCISKAKLNQDPDISKNLTIEEFDKVYKDNAEELITNIDLNGYTLFNVNKIYGIRVNKHYKDDVLNITYDLNDKRYCIECCCDRQSLIEELVDIVGIYRMQQPQKFDSNRSMIKFWNNFSRKVNR